MYMPVKINNSCVYTNNVALLIYGYIPTFVFLCSNIATLGRYIYILISLHMSFNIFVFIKPRATTFSNNINYVIIVIKVI